MADKGDTALGQERDAVVVTAGAQENDGVGAPAIDDPPQDVEFAVLHDPVFEQAMLIGEARPYVVLLAVSQETDEKELLKRANAQLKAFPRWMRVRRVIASREPWSVENGLLTPTLKLKRPMLVDRYRDRIDAAYASRDSG